MSDQTIHVHGNDHVLEQLNRAVELAKGGRFGYMALTMLTNTEPISVDTSHGGDSWLEQVAATTLRELAASMDYHCRLRQMPPPNPKYDASYVTFNVPAGPMSFDFLVWLINAEMTRVREDAPGPLKVNFWMGFDNNGHLEGDRGVMFEKVAKPSMPLLGAIETEIQSFRNETVYVPKRIVELSKLGEAVPRFKPTPLQALEMAKYAGAVTITLREAPQWPHRNSNLKSWLRFANDLTKKGEKVLFVRDTSKALEPLPYPICPEASIDLGMRCALYNAAKANLFVSNGPSQIAVYGDKPWFMFLPLEEDGHAYKINTPSFWRDHFGLTNGEQYPWSDKNQKLLWHKTDTYENIVEAWEQFDFS